MILASVFEQFEINKIINLAITNSLDLSITNATVFMAIGLGLYVFLYWASGLAEGRIIPGRIQTMLEGLYELVRGISVENIGGVEKGRKYMPWVMSIFMMILILNIVGLIPYTFTPTSQIAVTFGLSLSIWVGVTILGMVNYGTKYLSMFMPGGSPMVLSPIMVSLEMVSYSIRAVSLGVRLAANITAGHILFVILAGFIWKMMMMGGMVTLGSIIPMGIMAAVTVLEMGVAIIQAYVFSLLTAIYISESEELH